MAPTPLSAQWRVTFKYTVAGFQHRHQMYCNAVASADPSGYSVVGQVIVGNVGVSTLANPFFTLWEPYYVTPETTFDGWEFHRFVSGAWLFRAAGTTSVTPTGTGSAQLSMGFAVVGKDFANKFLPAYMYEGLVGTTAKHSSYSAQTTIEKAITDYYFRQSGTVINTDAWNWRCSRGTSIPQRWLSNVIDSNQKLRRLRHIA